MSLESLIFSVLTDIYQTMAGTQGISCVFFNKHCINNKIEVEINNYFIYAHHSKDFD